MTLPLILSVPHAGLSVPDYVARLCQLTQDEIVRDGDEGAAEVYDLGHAVDHLVTTDVARAILDLNRAVDDRHKDGVVKTHTCWDVPVYRQFPDEDTVNRLLHEHYHPYHRRLSELAGQAMLGVDCHTMASHGPPVGPDPGCLRPLVCLSDGDGACPRPWIESLAECFGPYFGDDVSVNHPFRGGYITRSHGREMPWVQLELSRAPVMSWSEKRQGVLSALTTWCAVPRERQRAERLEP